MDAVTILATLLFAFSGDMSADYCGAVTADACLQTTSCDMFTSVNTSDVSNQTSVCKTACDARINEQSCGLDSSCEWRDDACDYQLVDDVIGC